MSFQWTDATVYQGTRVLHRKASVSVGASGVLRVSTPEAAVVYVEADNLGSGKFRVTTEAGDRIVIKIGGAGGGCGCG